MSTYPCLIGIMNRDNTIKSIYCHCDGNVQNMAPLLIEHYNTVDKIEMLLSLGNILALDKNIKPTSDTHSFIHPEKDVTLAYHRDNDGEFIPAKTYNNKIEMMESWHSLAYLFNPKTNRWSYATYERFYPLMPKYNKLKQT